MALSSSPVMFSFPYIALYSKGLYNTFLKTYSMCSTVNHGFRALEIISEEFEHKTKL